MIVYQIKRRQRTSGGQSTPVTQFIALNPELLDFQDVLGGKGRGKARPQPPLADKLPKTARGLRAMLRATPWVFAASMAYEYYYRQAQTEYEFTNLGPWTQYGQCPTRTLTNPIAITTGVTSNPATWSNHTATNNCGSGYGVSTGLPFYPGNPFEAALNRNAIMIGNLNQPTPTSNRGAAVVSFAKPLGSPNHVPDLVYPKPAAIMSLNLFHGAPEVEEAIDMVRTLRPETIPVNFVRFGTPTPPAWKDVPHWQHPFREAKYSIHPRSNLKPNEEPLDWRWAASNAAIPSMRPTHVRRPPRRDEKEKKAKMTPAQILVWKTTAALNEGIELIDIFYGALPKKVMRPNLKPHEKLELIYKHFDKIDVIQLTENFMYNYVEDKLYGLVGKQQAKVNKRLDRPVGVGTIKTYFYRNAF